MECHACGRSVDDSDRFCNGCGASLQGVTDPTQLVDAVDDEVKGGAGGEDAPVSAPEHTELIPALVDELRDHDDPGNLDAPDIPDELEDPTEQESSIDEQRTELIPLTDDEEWEDEPAWARTGSVSTATVASEQAATEQITDVPITDQPITEVWMEKVPTDTDPPITTPYDFAEREPVAITGQVAAQPAMTEQMPVVVDAPYAAPRTGFRFGLTMLVAIVAALVALVAMFANILVITSDVALVSTPDTPETFRTGTWIADDLAGNISIAGLVAVVLLVMGGVASGFGWRWGSGLAGGAGLAMAGLAALTLGLAQFPIDVAHQFARVPATDQFVLTITRDLGYWLLIAAGALGVVLFFASIDDAVGDRRAGLNPWIAALGALAVVVAVAGPLIAENQALFSDNWYLVDSPGEPSALLLVGRLVQLGLLLLGGVIGFLSVRRWGLGVAFGASLPSVWLTLSTLLDLTDSPVGPGFRNPGAQDMHVHGVTIIGFSAVIAMLVLGAVGAYDQGARGRR